MLHVINREDVKKQGDAPWWDDSWKIVSNLHQGALGTSTVFSTYSTWQLFLGTVPYMGDWSVQKRRFYHPKWSFNHAKWCKMEILPSKKSGRNDIRCFLLAQSMDPRPGTNLKRPSHPMSLWMVRSQLWKIHSAVWSDFHLLTLLSPNMTLEHPLQMEELGENHLQRCDFPLPSITRG